MMEHHHQQQQQHHQQKPSPASYLQNIPGINMNLPANDPSVRTIKQHYYPEGGWGWVIIAVASFTHFISCPLTSPGISLLIIEIASNFDQHFVTAVFVGTFSTTVSLFASPLIISICRRKSSRLTGILGGLITALGCLFTSFATQFHQLFFSYGIFIGIGIAMIRDPGIILMGQYFKKKRELIEIPFHASQGLGIAFMPLLITFCIRSRSWRFGFQITALVISLAFFLGVLYRPASLYHPQRRAIMHLKSLQKRSRLKDQHLKTATAQNSLASAFSSATTGTTNKKGGSTSVQHSKKATDKPPYFDFSVLKSRTIQIILSGTCISHFGMTAPLFLMSTVGQMDGIEYACLMRLQIFSGLAFILGVLAFGFIVVKDSADCLISRQYLCQASTLIMAISLIAFTSFDDYQGYLLFVWIYGFFFGGYCYSIKMFILEKVRARNFNRAWSFLQASQSLPIFVGVPITRSKAGFYLCAGCLALGSLVFFFIDAHKSSKSRVNQVRTLASTHSGSAGTHSGPLTGRMSACSMINTDKSHKHGSANSSPTKSIHNHHHHPLNPENSLSDKGLLRHEAGGSDAAGDRRASIISSTRSSSCSAMDQKAKILKSYIESLSTNNTMSYEDEGIGESAAAVAALGGTAGARTSFPAPNLAVKEKKRSSSSSSGSSGNNCKKLVNNNVMSSSGSRAVNGNMVNGGSVSSAGSSSRSRSNSLFNSLIENHAAELTCISEEVFLENLLDDLIWDSGALEACGDGKSRGVGGGATSSRRLNDNDDDTGMEEEEFSQEERYLMLTEFENNFLLASRQIGCVEKENAIKGMIEKRKKELLRRQHPQLRPEDLQSLNLNFNGPHHENCPLSKLCSSSDHENSSIGGTSAAMMPTTAAAGVTPTNGLLIDSKKRRIMKKKSNRSETTSSGIDAGTRRGFSGLQPLPQRSTSSSGKAMTACSIGDSLLHPADRKRRNSVGESGASDDASAASASCPSNNENAGNGSDVSHCSSCRRPIVSSDSQAEVQKCHHQRHQEDDLQGDASSDTRPGVILEQSSTDEEEEAASGQASSGDRVIVSKSKKKNMRRHNGSVIQKKDRKIAKDCNDSFPEDEDDEDEEEADFLNGNDDEDDDDGHGKTFEQEDTIVYFHREACEHPHHAISNSAVILSAREAESSA